MTGPSCSTPGRLSTATYIVGTPGKMLIFFSAMSLTTAAGSKRGCRTSSAPSACRGSCRLKARRCGTAAARPACAPRPPQLADRSRSRRLHVLRVGRRQIGVGQHRAFRHAGRAAGILHAPRSLGQIAERMDRIAPVVVEQIVERYDALVTRRLPTAFLPSAICALHRTRARAPSRRSRRRSGS